MGWRPKDIATKLEKKEELDIEEARRLFYDFELLNNKNGFKLCVYLVLYRISAEEIWSKICDLALKGKLNKKYAEVLGQLLLVYYVKSPEFETERTSKGHKPEWKERIGTEVFKPLMESCILSKKRSVAEVFRLVFGALLKERRSDLNVRLFNISKGIVWKHIDSPNDNIRLGAYFVQQSLFPPTSEDQGEQDKYMGRHLRAFANALEDLSLPIRLMSIENVMEKFCFWFDEVPNEFRKELRRVLVTLVTDVNAKTRSSVFKAFRFFSAQISISAKNWAKDFLKAYVKDGIDDVDDSVRLAVFKLLNVLKNDSEFDIYYLIDLSAILNRLDFEENEDIEVKIAELLFEKWFGAVSYVQKFLNISQLCKINWNATLDLHRIIIGEEIMSNEKSLSYICGLSELLPPILNKACGENVALDSDLGREFSSQSSDKRLSVLKDVMDCLIVGYTLLQPELQQICGTQQSDLEVIVIQRRFTECIQIIMEKLSDDDGLMDTAMTLATMSPKTVNCLPKFKLDTERQIRSGKLDEKRLQVFAMSDMQKVVSFLLEGLDQCKTSSQKFLASSPAPTKKPRLSSVFMNEDTIIDALNCLISTPITKDYLLTEYEVSIGQITALLYEIRENYMYALRPKRTKFNQYNYIVKVIDLLTVFLIFKYVGNEEQQLEQTPKKNGSIKRDKAPISRRRSSLKSTPKSVRKRKLSDEMSFESTQKIDPLIKEVDLYKFHFQMCPNAIMKKPEISGAICRSIGLIAKAFVHRKDVLKDAQVLMDIFVEYKETHPQTAFPESDYSECCKSIDHALQFATEPVLIDSANVTPITSRSYRSLSSNSYSPEL
ncbi:unnamed protein product [Bursaphelenchus okinawaensis]|uniref:Uncharacterized protein n=1 Tax=Bursaphelenchus okinawaensis TaxID=465554 RepID=A0A811KTP7_9BILA|nr:unnamed protein product [Bursaphelenchus okinawaensis]CAG9111363.1 unnamed protein product [Bursaphelenchus okinawaensis]